MGFIEEIRRREKPIRIFLNMGSAYRLVGALCAETHKEWSTGRRYMKMGEFFEWKVSHSVDEDGESETEASRKTVTEIPDQAFTVAA